MADDISIKGSQFISTKKNLSAERTSDQEKERIKEVADLYEKYFIKELMRNMKSSLSEDGGVIKKNNAEKIFSEQLDEQYSNEWNKRGGFGLSEMIYKNIIEKHGDQLGLKDEEINTTGVTSPSYGDQLAWEIQSKKLQK